MSEQTTPAVKRIESHLRSKGIDANAWSNGSRRRVYINRWIDLAGIELSFYKSGNISCAWIDGEQVSNAAGRRASECIEKVWVDEDGSVQIKVAWGARDDYGTIDRVRSIITTALAGMEVPA